jgi:phage gpG-like protein
LARRQYTGALTFPERRLATLVKDIRGLANNATDLTPLWPKVGAYLSRMTRTQFATRGRRSGKPWKPLAPSTRREKERMGWPRSPLVRTGQLRQAYVGRPMEIEVYRKSTARFGSDLDKARWQHYGTYRNGKRHIPPRKIVVFTAGDIDHIADLIRKFLQPQKLG